MVEELDENDQYIDNQRELLRVITNCLASEQEEVQKLVSNSLSRVAKCLYNEALVAFSIAAMYNLCQDYEPARSSLGKLGIGDRLCTILNETKTSEGNATYDMVLEILTWMGNVSMIDEYETILERLQKQSRDQTMEGYKALIEVALAYLQNEAIQKNIAASCTSIGLMIDFLEENLRRLKILKDDPDSSSHLRREHDSEESHEYMHQQKSRSTQDQNADLIYTTSLTYCLHAVSITNEYRTISSDLLKDDCTTRLVKLMANTVEDHNELESNFLDISISACIMLGNMVTSHDLAYAMVEDLSILHPIGVILGKSRDIGMLFAIMGLTKQLAIFPQNRSKMRTHGIFDMCFLILQVKHTRLQMETMAVIRLLLTDELCAVDSLLNQKLLSIETRLETSGNTKNSTGDDLLVDVLLQYEAISETGRALAAVVRVIHKSTDSDGRRARLLKLYERNICDPLFRIINQKEDAALRSEGLLALGFMTQTSEGAEKLIKALEGGESMFGLFQEVAKLERTSNLSGTPTDLDRKNIQMIVHGILKYCVSNNSK